MSKLHEGSEKGFHVSHKAWYKNIISTPSISIGMYQDDGSTTGEFSISWEELGGELVPRINMYDDAWDLFKTMAELFSALPEMNDTKPSPDGVIKLLKSLGYKDLTKYKWEPTKLIYQWQK